MSSVSETNLAYAITGLLLLSLAMVLFGLPIVATVFAVSGVGTSIAMLATNSSSEPTFIVQNEVPQPPLPSLPSLRRSSTTPTRIEQHHPSSVNSYRPPLAYRPSRGEGRIHPGGRIHPPPTRFVRPSPPSPSPPPPTSIEPLPRGVDFDDQMRPIGKRLPVLDEKVASKESSGGAWTPPQPSQQELDAMRQRSMNRPTGSRMHRDGWMDDEQHQAMHHANRNIPNVTEPLDTIVQNQGKAYSVLHAPEMVTERPLQGLPEFSPGLPSCNPSTPAGIIRDQGLYGIKGDYNCDIMKRSAVANTGFVQPLGARNEFLKYASYDMPNRRNQYMIRKEGPKMRR